jgi:hypothetical protein
MDTTNINANMCLKAEEIQECWVPKKGDRVVFFEPLAKGHILVDKTLQYLAGEEVDSVCSVIVGSRILPGSIKMVFVPRQDQLQNMLEYKTVHGMLNIFNIFVTNNKDDKEMKSYSIEQFLLAFVMNNLFNKKWTGEEWIIIL